MVMRRGQADLFDGEGLEFEIDGVILPDDHSVFKLFPGKTYRLAKAMRDSGYAFLDINGLGRLDGPPESWTDEALLGLITLDRLSRSDQSQRSRKKRPRGSDQDKKRLGFVKNLFFTAKKGDLVLVPLGEGYAGKVGVGELLDEAGKVDRVQYSDNEDSFITYGRKVRWLADLNRFSLPPNLVKSLHSPTAFHVIPRDSQEQLYVAVYGTFAYRGVYVAKFASSRETLGAQDYANIGVLFNGLAVAHDAASPASDSPSAPKKTFYELAIEQDGSATIEFQRNSPISAILRTVGPLAFTAALMFSGAAEGQTLVSLQHASVVARPIGKAVDRCHIEVPPDMAAAAIGLGEKRFETFCAVRKKVEKEASMRSPARLKKHHKKPK